MSHKQEAYGNLSTQDIQKLAKKAGVNTPVMSVRVVGDRVELHLLGGTVVPIQQGTNETLPTTTAQTGQSASSLETPPDPLADLTVSQMKYVAQFLGLTGYSKLTKQQLYDRLNANFTDAQLAEAARA